jgi:hypothetical protein
VVLRGRGVPALLERLDGRLEAADVTALHPGAPALLAALAAAGLLDDAAAEPGPLRALPPLQRDRLAPDLASWALLGDDTGGAATLARRRGCRVRVAGGGRVGLALALLLAHAGVGRVDVDDDTPVRPQDLAPGSWGPHVLGQPRASAAAGLLAQAAPLPPLAPGPAHLVVVSPDPGCCADLAALATHLRDGQAHLVVELAETLGRVGPLVRPGATPCVRCLHLHRRDRDGAWPLVAAQLSTPAPGTPAADAGLCAALAGQAALAALSALDVVGPGGAAPAPTGTRWDGTVWELALPTGQLRARRWPAHPECGCGWQGAAATTPRA